MVDLLSLNASDKDGFIRVLGDIFEHSPWIAEKAYGLRPFTSMQELYNVLINVVMTATPLQQLSLIRAHPDLASKAGLANLSTHSKTEQMAAGLDALTPEEFQRFTTLNQAYKDKFDFPFILAVKEHNKHSILTHFQTRLSNDVKQEIEIALKEICKIAKFRLEALTISS